MPKRLNYWDSHKTVTEAYISLAEFARPDRDHFILVFLAAIIGSIGMLLGNMTVIMGAVIIAPLMGPILGISLSLVVRRRSLLVRYLGSVIASIALVLLVSYVFGVAFSFLGFTPALIERTQSNVLHVLLALTAGFLAGYGRIRHNILDRAFGVAMSVSLLPPLCVLGITLAHQDPDLALGSLLSFGNNLISILFGSILAFTLLDFERFKVRALKRLSLAGFCLVLFSIPLFWSFETISLERQAAHELEGVLMQYHEKFPHVEIDNIEADNFESENILLITLKAEPGVIQTEQATIIKKALEKRLHRKIKLTLHVHTTPTQEIQLN